MKVNLNIDKSAFVPKFFPLLFDYSHRWEVYKGSAGSSKSYFITQKLIIRAVNEKIKIMVCRKYGTTIRHTCFALFKDVLDSWQLTQYVNIRESDFNIRFPNGSEIIFTGLDEETKLLSLSGIGCIFIEEAYEVPRSIVDQLNLRLRGKTDNQQIIMAFNPISKSHWLYDFCEVNPPKSFIYTHSTYKDNPFLNQDYINELDEMEKRNPAKYQVFGKGEWGVDVSGLVITNYSIEDFDEVEIASRRGIEHRSGCDFGWVDPTSVIDSLYDPDEHTIYVFNEFYKSGAQLSQLAKAIEDMHLTKNPLYCDAAEPRSIEFLRSKHINARACKKGKDSIRLGLQFLQDNKIIIKPRCKHFIHEVENFSYIKNKVTGEFTEDTTHEFSHAIDALRYGYSDIYTNKKIKTYSKNVFGL